MKTKSTWRSGGPMRICLIVQLILLSILFLFKPGTAYSFSGAVAKHHLRHSTTLWNINKYISMSAHQNKHDAIPRTRLYGFSDPNWNWGYAQGTAHDAAMVVRDKLSDQDLRRQYVDSLQNAKNRKLSDNEEEFDELKLVLALRFQRAAREGIPGSQMGWRIMQNMADCKYENNGTAGKGVALLFDDLKALCEDLSLHIPSDGEDASDSYQVLKAVAADVLIGMKFVEVGL